MTSTSRAIRALLGFLAVTSFARAARADEDPPPATSSPTDAAPAPTPSSAIPVPTSTPPTVTTVVPSPAPPDASPTGFRFGSYGRVAAATDLTGSTTRPVNVVLFGSRVDEPSYLELDLSYLGHAAGGVEWRTVTTFAVLGEPFHYTGNFSAQTAIRNLYLEIHLPSGVRVWAGSRMYRGDDIYLLDYWPLDNANTLGGGIGFARDRLDVGAHVGVERLVDPFQFQEHAVPSTGVGATTIVTLDRQRLSSSLKGSYRFYGAPGGPALKAKGYFSVEGLPAGSRFRDDQSTEDLPADYGMTLGAQLGAWGFGGAHDHENLFVRWSRGISAYGDLSVPFGFDANKQTYSGADEVVLGFSANHEARRWGVLAGGYLRSFHDASPSDDLREGWEYIVDARPYVQVSGPFAAAVDVSWQERAPRGLNVNGLAAPAPQVFQVAPMITITPDGPGSYARPQLRLVYKAAWQNEGALDLYPTGDSRRDRTWVQYLGVQAEWWFNSSYR